MRPRHLLASLLFAFIASSTLAQSPSGADVVLHGEIHPDQNKSYVESPFEVPAGTHRITVSFHNLGRDQHTVIDLGIADPFRFRGASGGNKDHFTLSETDATPSYLPGAIPPGAWKLLFSVPNIRPGVTTQWRAEIRFNSAADDSSFTDAPLRTGPAWFRGDFHMHTAHSDGSCPSETGKPVPCPLFLTLEDAARRRLDFIAVTDHNTTSQYEDERELQAYFDKLLLIPGRELTTFYGHANEWGSTRFIDYRVGSASVPDMNTMFRDARAAGAIVSINHPESPTGEICMGCGWTPPTPLDMSLATSVEVINGGGRPATHFWEQQLEKGYRLTAVGGSDNHHADWPPDKAGSVGYPTTVVYARDLSVAAILDGIRSGRVFIDATGSDDRILEMQATADNAIAEMGGDLELHSSQALALEVHVKGCKGASVQFFVDGQPSAEFPPLSVTDADQVLHAQGKTGTARHWIRAEVHDANGRLLLLGNPIYLGFNSPRPQ
jgi:hypothetical protein